MFFFLFYLDAADLKLYRAVLGSTGLGQLPLSALQNLPSVLGMSAMQNHLVSPFASFPHQLPQHYVGSGAPSSLYHYPDYSAAGFGSPAHMPRSFGVSSHRFAPPPYSAGMDSGLAHHAFYQPQQPMVAPSIPSAAVSSDLSVVEKPSVSGNISTMPAGTQAVSPAANSSSSQPASVDSVAQNRPQYQGANYRPNRPFYRPANNYRQPYNQFRPWVPRFAGPRYPPPPSGYVKDGSSKDYRSRSRSRSRDRSHRSSHHSSSRSSHDRSRHRSNDRHNYRSSDRHSGSSSKRSHNGSSSKHSHGSSSSKDNRSKQSNSETKVITHKDSTNSRDNPSAPKEQRPKKGGPPSKDPIAVSPGEFFIDIFPFFYMFLFIYLFPTLLYFCFAVFFQLFILFDFRSLFFNSYFIFYFLFGFY